MLIKPTMNPLLDPNEIMVGICQSCKTTVECKRKDTRSDKKSVWPDVIFVECPNENCGARVSVVVKNPKPREEPKFINVFAKPPRKETKDKPTKKDKDKQDTKLQSCPDCGVKVNVTKKDTVSEDGTIIVDLLYSWHFDPSGSWCSRSMSTL